MSRVLSCSVLLLIMASTPVGADMFKCQRPDGTIMFTDDPTRSSGDCKMERVTDLPTIGTLPDRPQSQAPPPAAQQAAPTRSNDDRTNALDAFRSEAARLVEQFQSARHQVVYATLASDKLAARRELAAIRAQKDSLLENLKGSTLSASEQREIAGLLSAISESALKKP